MDQERYVAEPNQVLHPGQGRVEHFNDASGAVYRTTHLDAHGNAFTQNHSLSLEERYGYNYVGGHAPTPPPASAPIWNQPAAGAAVAGTMGTAAAADGIVTGFVRDRQSQEVDPDDALKFIVWAVIITVVVALGPLIAGIWLYRRARSRGTTTAHAIFLMLLEGAWLATLWAWLFDGGPAAWFSAATVFSSALAWYLLTLRTEARWRREDAADAAALDDDRGQN